MAASIPPRTGGFLNSDEIQKLFQPQWENTDKVLPVASYSAAKLYRSEESSAASTIPNQVPHEKDTGGQDSASSDTEASTDKPDAGTRSTSVDNGLTPPEQPAKSARTDAYYPLAMTKRQRVTVAKDGRRKESRAEPNRDLQRNARTAAESSDQTAATNLTGSSFGEKEQWYYPAAMSLGVQQAQYKSQREAPLHQASAVPPFTQDKNGPVHSGRDHQAWCPLCSSTTVHPDSPAKAPVTPGGIYGGFFAPQQQIPQAEWQHPSKRPRDHQYPSMPARASETNYLGNPARESQPAKAFNQSKLPGYYAKGMRMQQMPEHPSLPSERLQDCASSPQDAQGTGATRPRASISGGIYAGYFGSQNF